MLTKKTESNFTFDLISGIYALFFKRQKEKFDFAVLSAKHVFDISQFESALDLGCGTGALCSVLSKAGLKMTGVDNSKKMLKIARRKNAESNINFMHHDALNGLPFIDNSFDFSIASYVSHGLVPDDRKKLLLEMKRVSAQYVVLHEFGKKRSLPTDIIEWLEGGNYFTFLKTIESELDAIFDDVSIIKVGKNSLWYVCKV